MIKQTKGFTLVELLVVVAIIALLVSILLPSLGKAKEQTRIVMCLSNLKGLSLGFAFYTQVNNDWYPPGCIIGGYEPTWDANIRPYYENRGLLHCPSDPVGGDPICGGHDRLWCWTARGTPQNDRFPRSYAINCDVSWPAPRPDYDFPWGTYINKTNGITDPGDTILLGEMWYAMYWTDPLPGMYNVYYVSGIHTTWGFNPGGRDATGDVHRNNDAANYLFCDGHVTILSENDSNLTDETDYYYWKREK